MINRKARIYNYYTLGEINEYGQRTISEEPTGRIRMAIDIITQNTEENILYQGATFIGLTTERQVNDKMIIEYYDEELDSYQKMKVLYVNPMGRLKQVFMSVIKWALK